MTAARVGMLQVLKVVSCVAGSDAQRALHPGDLLLAVNGQPVTSFPALDALLAGLSQDNTSPTAAGDSSQAAQQVLRVFQVMCTQRC
jgi:S1-C subfamily serine protease